MYATTVVAMLSLLVAGSFAASTGSITGNQDVIIEESTYHRTGNLQETHRNTTQHRVPGHVDIIVFQGNSNDTRDESGNIKKIHSNGTTEGALPINTNSDDNGEGNSSTSTSVEASSTISSTDDGDEAGTNTDSSDYDSATSDIEDVTIPRSGEDSDASDGSDDEGDNDTDAARNGGTVVPDIAGSVGPSGSSNPSSSEEENESRED